MMTPMIDSARALTVLLMMSIVCLTLVGCTNPLGGNGSVLGATHTPGVDSGPKSVSGHEFVSSSAQLVSTNGARFRVQGSVSNSTDKLTGTTSRGYKLLLNVQGEMMSAGSL